MSKLNSMVHLLWYVTNKGIGNVFLQSIRFASKKFKYHKEKLSDLKLMPYQRLSFSSTLIFLSFMNSWFSFFVRKIHLTKLPHFHLKQWLKCMSQESKVIIHLKVCCSGNVLNLNE